jgi:hypothetical protein
VLALGLMLLSAGVAVATAPGTWTLTSRMTTARVAHTATLLTTGQVLVAGGSTSPLTELYDPASGTWRPTGSLNAARRGHTATLLSNGQVLIAAGADRSGNRLASAELYDPVTGAWSPTGSLNQARHRHTATPTVPHASVATSRLAAEQPPSGGRP